MQRALVHEAGVSVHFVHGCWLAIGDNAYDPVMIDVHSDSREHFCYGSEYFA